MFSQPSADREAPKLVKSSHKINKATRRKRRKKLARKLKRQAQEAVKKATQPQVKPDSIINKRNIEISMSSWAENFTVAATWQLKHQVAHWKARVKALEYENKVLRDTLRKHFAGEIPELNHDVEYTETEIGDEIDGANETSALESASIATDDISVDEEYIQYAMETLACRQEEQRIAETQEKVEEPEIENTTEVLKELYGDKWQRIAALEQSLQSYFMSECDKRKPVYWPNMPLNC